MTKATSMLGPITNALAAVLLLLTLCSCAEAPDDVRTADIEGREVSYRVLGSGQPVLVMISGLGDGMSSFEDVAPELAEHATVIVYDRAGYGGSSVASDVRDAAAADRELSALLAQSGVEGPYFVLGHSIGGLFAEYFAAQHPDATAGLLLEDSRPSDFTRRCHAASLAFCTPPAVLMMLAPKGAQHEFAALPSTVREIEGGATTGSPTLVLSRHIADDPSAKDALWSEAQADLTARYPGARRAISPAGGHYIHVDAREWFVSSVRAFMQQHMAPATTG